MQRLRGEARRLFENDKLAAVQCAGGLRTGDATLAAISTDGSHVAWARAAPGTSSLPADCRVAPARPVPHKTAQAEHFGHIQALTPQSQPACLDYDYYFYDYFPSAAPISSPESTSGHWHYAKTACVSHSVLLPGLHAAGFPTCDRTWLLPSSISPPQPPGAGN